MIKSLISKTAVAAALLTVAFATFGCGGNSTTPTNSGPATLRAIHASPSAGGVDVRLRDVPIATNLAYGTSFPSATEPFQTVSAGLANVEVFPTGTSVAALQGVFNLASETHTTVVVAGLAEDTGTNALRAIPVVDSRRTLDATRVNLRVVHVSVLAQSVDIYVTAPAADITDIAPSIADFNRYAVSPLVQLPAGEYRIRVTLAGSKDVVVDQSVSLVANRYLTIVAQDTADRNGVELKTYSSPAFALRPN